MNIAHPAIAAEADASCADRVFARVVAARPFASRSLARSFGAGALALLLAATSTTALADPPPRDDRYSQRSERAAQQREDVRRFDPRVYEAREEQRRQQMDNHPDRRGGRLSPDERRDLRRQINEAGMDIYPNAPRR